MRAYLDCCLGDACHHPSGLNGSLTLKLVVTVTTTIPCSVSKLLKGLGFPIDFGGGHCHTAVLSVHVGMTSLVLLVVV